MSTDPRLDTQEATSEEVRIAHNLNKDTVGLRKYWNDLFDKQYLVVLEDAAEIGRHGIIGEIIQRFGKAGNVLDAGCGTGILSELLDLNKFNYFGCDISDIAIDYAQSKRSKSKVTFYKTRIEELQKINDLTVIVFNEVLYYLDTKAVLTIIKKWLREDGLIIVSNFDFPDGNKITSWLKQQLEILVDVFVVNTNKNFRWNILAGSLKK